MGTSQAHPIRLVGQNEKELTTMQRDAQGVVRIVESIHILAALAHAFACKQAG
jgi:hypothetical protein